MTDAIQTKLIGEIAEIIDESDQSAPIDIIEFIIDHVLGLYICETLLEIIP